MGSSLGNMLGKTPDSKEQGMRKSGASFRDQNDIKRYNEEGLTVKQISSLTKVNEQTVQSFVDKFDEESLAERVPDPDKE